MVHEQIRRLLPLGHNTRMGVLLLMAVSLQMPCTSVAAADRLTIRTASSRQPTSRRMRVRSLWQCQKCADRRRTSMAWGKSLEMTTAQPSSLPSVSGTITSEGVPLGGGMIEFHEDAQPTEGVKVDIRDGRYSIPNLPPGQYRIKIRSVPDPVKAEQAQDAP